ncbi:cysteine proteinase inhibitor 1-like [Wolffia australiana]
MRTQLPSLLLIVAVLSAVAFQAYATLEEPTPPGWDRIKKPADYQHALDIARFAVKRHNWETDEKLSFARMVRGYVSGQYYKLIIEASDGANKCTNKYETLVREKVPNKVRELIYFTSS